MELDIESKLNDTRTLLEEFGSSVKSLVKSSIEVFKDEGLRKSVKELLDVYEEAKQRLANPSFRIATLGTTSSGKSTIVNALIGRKIAPIEAGEMSGGVLSLKHSQEHRLIIAKTDDAAWETGDWTGLSDEDLYQRIGTVMRSYHEARKKREYVAPQITAYIPLLPASNNFLLGLPNGIGVELIDLPGMKSVQDRANLTVIQQQVNKAFSLVALDYGQVDDEKRRRLLEELKKVVEYSQGRTDSMIFILNRVDQRGADDLPLETRISQLKEEIKEVLSLPELPDIIPFNARLLYYVQCAWGSGAFNEPSLVNQGTRLRFLKAMFQDCASIIKLKTQDNRDLKNWFRAIEDQVAENKDIDDQIMRRMFRYALEWSSGEKLWYCFRKRLQESCAKLIIRPALVELLNTYDAFEKSFDVLIQARKISSQEQVQQELNKITEISQSLKEKIGEVNGEFKIVTEKIFGIEEGLKNKDPKTYIKVKQYLDKKGYKDSDFYVILDVVADVETDLTTNLIVPVRDALKNNQGAFELRDKLYKCISPALAEDIAKAYDHVSRRLSKFSAESEYLVKRVRADDEQGKQELEHDERYVRLLYHTMRQAISARAEFVLQSKAQQFIKALEFLVDEQVEKLKKACLSQENFLSTYVDQAATSTLRKKLAQNLPILPEKFFELPDTIKQRNTKVSEVIGKETKDSGSCFGGKQERDIIKGIEYSGLFLPSPVLMTKEWSHGIGIGKNSLWDVLSDWISNRLYDANSSFEESVNEINNLAERALQQQSAIIEENFEKEKQFWRDFDASKDHATSLCQKLGESFYQ